MDLSRCGYKHPKTNRSHRGALTLGRRQRIFVEFPDGISETTPDGPQARTREQLEAAGAGLSYEVTLIRVVYKYTDRTGMDTRNTLAHYDVGLNRE